MRINDDQRPDPDVLLEQVQAQQARAARGKLRIYFGASAGVGKTYAMLAAARKLMQDGQEVLVGIVETHGRSETATLLDGLVLLPLKEIGYRGKIVKEFDLDAALARHPALLLVDELAHSNAPGSRHPKRWQDVEECLNAGIDVYTTVNVQHLESLNDVVGGITGIRVAETLPDTVFDAADEVVLVDVPADELLARLKAGKVYQGKQAERASQNFFRKGNLIALRELALRRTADRIQDDVQAYRIEKSISSVWKTDSALLVAVGPQAGAQHLIRSSAQLASQLNAEWHVVYVETPALQRLPSSQREYILKSLKLAQDLGAVTTVLTGNDVARAITDYAQSHNFSRIILGRAHAVWLWRIPLLRRIAQRAPDLDLIEIGRPAAQQATAQYTAGTAPAEHPASGAQRVRNAWGYGYALLASLLTALLATPLLPHIDLANIVMLFLLTVVLVAVLLGRGPAVLAAFVGVAAFDFFFVPPRFSFAISDFQYLLTFGVMLAVGLITGQLTAGARYQARIAARREERARALYEFARALSAVLQTEQIFEITRSTIQRTFHARATLLLPDDAGHLSLPSEAQEAGGIDLGIAQWAFDRAQPAGIGTDTLPGSQFLYLPLIAPMRTRGILALQPASRRWLLVPEQRQQLDTFTALAAIALERVHYVEIAQDALIRMESERLRNSLLAALSHDLRTPLTALVGLSESLAMSMPSLSAPQLELAEALKNETLRMSALVTNLLDMARIQSGEVKLNLQWQSIEELVGSALQLCRALLVQHRIRTRIASDLPLVRVDGVLMERVLCNLLENAAKYTPSGATIMISALARNGFMEVAVSDNGPGLAAGREEAIFEKFTRGERESATPGVGLGLAICRAIVEAHGGSIRAKSGVATGIAAVSITESATDSGHCQGSGASFIFTLPLGTPPAMPEFTEAKEAPL